MQRWRIISDFLAQQPDCIAQDKPHPSGSISPKWKPHSSSYPNGAAATISKKEAKKMSVASTMIMAMSVRETAKTFLKEHAAN
jgi:hypothetical protein